MNKKKVIPILLVLAIIVSIFAINNNVQATSPDITVKEYKASTIVDGNGYQIDKYADVESEGWISDNEVLTLTEKEEYKDAYNYSAIKYCSVYNLNTTESKDFKDVNIYELLGISPDKNYVLYAEEINITPWESEECKAAIEAGEEININDAKWESEEHKAAIASGAFFHRNVKLLNLSTGEITDVATEFRNNDTELRWVDGNNILINYHNKWQVVDLDGEVLVEGIYKNDSTNFSNLAGVDDIKCLDNGFEGKIYYTTSESWIVGEVLYSMNVKTKAVEKFSFNYGSKCLGADKRGNTILMNNMKYNESINSNEPLVNSSFGAHILDETGKLLQDIDFTADRYTMDFTLSPDGSKVAFIEANYTSKQQDGTHEDPVLKIIDIKKGNKIEIVKGTDLNDNTPDISKGTDLDNSNLEYEVEETPVTTSCFSQAVKWDNTGTSVSFTYSGNTYIVSFDN